MYHPQRTDADHVEWLALQDLPVYNPEYLKETNHHCEDACQPARDVFLYPKLTRRYQ
jgi:hypothetical protein